MSVQKLSKNSVMDKGGSVSVCVCARARARVCVCVCECVHICIYDSL